jgi:hypothetical protein
MTLPKAFKPSYTKIRLGSPSIVKGVSRLCNGGIRELSLEKSTINVRGNLITLESHNLKSLQALTKLTTICTLP